MTRYREALAWLYSLQSRGAKLGLERMRAGAKARGNPQRKLRVLHVAGTNGKGSVVTFAESILRQAGYRTGKFVSPHLQRFVERVQIDGRPITEREAATRILGMRRDKRLSGLGLTFFEHTTLLALEAFADANVDVAVVEVGLGGRLDSTNIVAPATTVITNIGLDHERVLGDTVAKIAAEKAGILKRRVPVVIGARDAAALRVIRRHAKKQQAPTIEIDRDFESTWRQSRLDIRVGQNLHEGMRLGIAGRFQQDNAACAVAAVQVLGSRGLPVSDGAVERGLGRAKWPGRLERVAGQPSILFDAAHNLAGCLALRRYVDELEHDGPVVLLFGAMKDKAHRPLLAAFDGVADHRVYAVPEMSRAGSPKAFHRIRKGEIASTVAEGLARAEALAGPDGLVLVAGSIFLVSEVRAIALGVRTDPVIGM